MLTYLKQLYLPQKYLKQKDRKVLIGSKTSVADPDPDPVRSGRFWVKYPAEFSTTEFRRIFTEF